MTGGRAITDGWRSCAVRRILKDIKITRDIARTRARLDRLTRDRDDLIRQRRDGGTPWAELVALTGLSQQGLAKALARTRDLD